MVYYAIEKPVELGLVPVTGPVAWPSGRMDANLAVLVGILPERARAYPGPLG